MTSRTKEYLSRGLIAALYGGSLSAVFAAIADFPFTVWAAFAASCGAAVVFTLGGLWKKTLFATLPLCAAAVFLLKIPQGVSAAFTGEPDSILLSALIALLFALVGCLFSGQRSGAFLMTILYGLAVIFSRRNEDPVPLILIAPGALALIMQCAYATGKKGAQWNALIPTALIAAVLAFALTPAEGTYWQPLNDLAKNIQQKISDLTDVLGQYGGFNEDRVAYSVCMDGYQPMVNMLGGPATPEQTAVMDVTADTALYLRGSIRRYYNGHSWIDDSVNSRYVFLDPSKKHLRDEIFDANRSDGTPVSAEIVFLKASESSALFVPHRLSKLDLDALSMVAYYNSAGEVFLTRPVEAEDSYRIEAEILMIDNIPAELPDDGYEEIRTEYTRLPDGIEAEVYQLAGTLASPSGNTLETVRNIQKWLAENCRYETMVDYPPLDRDFVSYFVLDSREGYCTYFASAFSVLCRMCGIPTRYIEGYLAVPGEDGIAHVTGENAHAWVEVYCSGFGWVTADPTAAAKDAEGQSGNNDPDQPGETPEESEDNSEPDTEPEEEPQEPENEPEEPEDEPESEPEEEPENEPEEEPDEEPEEKPDDEPEEPQKNRLFLAVLLILLLLAAAAALIVLRLRKTDPRRMIAKEASGTGKLLIIYRALLTALGYRGIRPQPNETAEAFLERLFTEGVLPAAAKDFARELTGAVYSGRSDGEGAQNALTVYTAALKGMRFPAKLRWTAHRIRSGIGSTQNIP